MLRPQTTISPGEIIPYLTREGLAAVLYNDGSLTANTTSEARSSTQMMDSSQKGQASSLFQVYLRLRPHRARLPNADAERFLLVEEPEDGGAPTHITLNPPMDRRRAIEKFAFTQVFEEASSQLDIFHGTRVLPLVEGVLAPQGGEGTDGLLATLGVTGSGKTHTMLGSRQQRGMTQLALDVMFRGIDASIVDCTRSSSLETSIQASDASDATLLTAPAFLETVFSDFSGPSRAGSRAATPMITDHAPPPTPRRHIQRPSALPQAPDISAARASSDPSAEYAIVISMYEVYNDRIFDLLTPPIKSNATKEYKRRPLLFKPTENSPDRKVVAGLRKIICSSLKEALMVLEAGLHERRVAGTGSNSVSSRSHGFFNVEVKKRRRSRTASHWSTSTLSIVDLAGSERARDAKTQGATLAEAGKINESLMYLGQCLQMQSDAASATKPNLVPFRQCKLTELLFSNSFPSTSLAQSTTHRRPLQKGVMIVTADASGDYNANSQILRYSALAREVTVPRVPSITSTILAPGQAQQDLSSSPTSTSPIAQRMHHPSATHSRTFSPMSDTERGTMENAALEIARMADIIDQLNAELAKESEARMEAEAHLMSMEDRVVELEQEIREDCYADFEQRLAMEMNRWKASLSLEQERGEEHWDRKVEVLARGVGVANNHDNGDDSEDEDKENILIESLEQENDRLRREIAVLKRELTTRTPSKRAPLQERGDVPSTKGELSSLGSSMENLRISTSSNGAEDPAKKGIRVSSTGSPTKKVRKLPARKWESIDADADNSLM
ncbi:P-loop containing nucleoside triphosphate hydrolase protein [Microdochium trichocladiopsis]|uniref:Kinesin-like protein n=1 Tax=Microdochium trichocladiopsis TaxID=1682393 RepID=A0A9P8YFY5_9PEZI|nr:P-loop containing nucleoside triphosphate hydrolase protein [Microdochium trichocladiopsis]KAH7039664.1 P-loop containing nucleoside triphosphate hydrolase protein [Microdochium trichocladiopsis]